MLENVTVMKRPRSPSLLFYPAKKNNSTKKVSFGFNEVLILEVGHKQMNKALFQSTENMTLINCQKIVYYKKILQAKGNLTSLQAQLPAIKRILAGYLIELRELALEFTLKNEDLSIFKCFIDKLKKQWTTVIAILRTITCVEEQKNNPDMACSPCS